MLSNVTLYHDNLIVFLILLHLKKSLIMKFFSIISVFAVTATFFSCSTSQKLETLKPEPDDASPLIYDANPSFINLPITVKQNDIENQNTKLL